MLVTGADTTQPRRTGHSTSKARGAGNTQSWGAGGCCVLVLLPMPRQSRSRGNTMGDHGKESGILPAWQDLMCWKKPRGLLTAAPMAQPPCGAIPDGTEVTPAPGCCHQLPGHMAALAKGLLSVGPGRQVMEVQREAQGLQRGESAAV